jgi:ammonium transporter, Amt family
MKKITLFILLLALMIVPILSNLIFVDQITSIKTPVFDTGDIAWMLVASALVLLMTPGLAFFYGGLVGRKNIISTMFQSFLAMIVIAVLWVVVGYGLCFGPTINGFIGDPSANLFFQGVDSSSSWVSSPTIPLILFAVYQMMFAIITPALVTGSFAERVRLAPYILFVILFMILIYAPVAHWTWNPDGFLQKLGVIDFAGGTVVHMTAGWTALAAAIFLGRRRVQVVHQAEVPYVLLGTALLWVGWLGFNAGSAFGANEIATQAFLNTVVAAAAAGVVWVLLDVIRGREMTAVEACLGILVGLITITPAAGYVTTWHAISIGCIGSVVSYLVVSVFPKGVIDDALDVFGCHAVAGITGMLLTGVFATKTINPTILQEGLLFGGDQLFLSQLIGVGIVSVFSFVMAYLIFFVINIITPMRVSEELEEAGLDIEQIRGIWQENK